MESTGTKKTIAIIGGGPSGLVTAKECLVGGLKPTIFEKEAEIGGLWHPKTGGTWHGMQTNISRFTCSFSDFPWPKSTADFPTQQEVYQYFCDYLEHFGLREHIRFNSRVKQVKKDGDEKWSVTIVQGDKEETMKFDYVVIASGIFSKKYSPQFSHQEGNIIHSSDYKDPRQVKGEKVVVIGGSFSGAEIISDLCKAGKKVTNIIKSSMWILPRYLPDKSLKGEPRIPLDLLFYKIKKPPTQIPSLQDQWKGKNNYFNSISNQGEICSDLKIEDFTQPPKIAISDDYLENIKTGGIKIVKGNIESFDKNGIKLEGGHHEQADTIIIATGYLLDLPFFEQDILDKISFEPEDQLQPVLLYKTMFHPDLKNLAFVGIYKGPYFGVLELQARWAVSIFGQKQEYPSREVMMRGIQEERDIREGNPRLQFPHGDYIEFASTLAQQINVRPDYDQIEKSDPELYEKLTKYALIPAHFRLSGDGKNVQVALEQIDEQVAFIQRFAQGAQSK